LLAGDIKTGVSASLTADRVEEAALALMVGGSCLALGNHFSLPLEGGYWV